MICLMTLYNSIIYILSDIANISNDEALLLGTGNVRVMCKSLNVL